MSSTNIFTIFLKPSHLIFAFFYSIAISVLKKLLYPQKKNYNWILKSTLKENFLFKEKHWKNVYHY